MSLIEKFKRDIAKHPGRAVILGILFVTMVVMGVRAFLELRGPAAASAAAIPPSGPGTLAAAAPGVQVDSAQVQRRIDESRKLWTILRTVNAKGVAARDAFTFDPAQYPAPAPVIDPVKPGPEVVIVPSPAAPVVDDSKIRQARVREEARALVIKSITTASGAGEPMAILNQQLVTVGQKILGFEVVAIRAREVEFVKEGVTIVVKMPDGQ